MVHRCATARSRLPRRFRVSRVVAIAGGLVCGWLAAWAEADAADGFALFMPSRSEQRLLVVRVQPANDEVTLEMISAVNLGFRAGTITADSTRPLLYVSGGQGEDGHNGAVVPLDEAGLPQAAKPVSLDRLSQWRWPAFFEARQDGCLTSDCSAGVSVGHN